MLFSVDADATLINHWEFVVSYWIGCPISPEFLSDTLLTTFSTPPFALMLSGVPFSASLSVFAILIFVVVVSPLVIAKYTIFGVNPSGRCPLSLNIRIDSPSKKVWDWVNVSTLDVPPELNAPILLIPAALLFTLKDFSELDWDPGITIRDEYSVADPADATRTFKVSFTLVPIL